MATGIPCITCQTEIPVHLVENGNCPRCGNRLRQEIATPPPQYASSTSGPSVPGPVPPPIPRPVPLSPVYEKMIHCRHCGGRMQEKAMACMSCGLPRGAGRNHCWNCGSSTHEHAVICVKCGVDLNRQQASSIPGLTSGNSGNFVRGTSLDPVVAAVISFFLPGIGQLIIGQTTKGIMTFVVACVVGVLTLGTAYPIGSILSGVDGYILAKRVKDGKQIREWECFWN